MKINKLWILSKKDLKITLSNYTSLALLGLPLIFSILYKFVFDLGNDVLVLLITTSLALMMLGVSTVSSSIAEEKEKNTLRSLFLAGVTGFEFLFSKIIVVLIIGLVELLVIFFMSGVTTDILLPYMWYSSLTLISILLLSAQLGISSKDTKSVGYQSLPLMLLLMFPMIGSLNSGTLLSEISSWLPTGPINQYLVSLVSPEFTFSLSKTYIVLIGWIVIAFAFFMYTYKRKGIDN